MTILYETYYHSILKMMVLYCHVCGNTTPITFGINYCTECENRRKRDQYTRKEILCV